MKKGERKIIGEMKRVFDKWLWEDYLILIGMVIMFTPTFYRLITKGWKNADYTHAYFILPISLWLLLRDNQAFERSERVSVLGIIYLFSGILCYAFSILNEFMFLEAFSFVLIMWAIFCLRFNKESFGRMLFPMAYLLFLIPPPFIAIDAISMPLKQVSTQGAYFVLKSFHFPVAMYGVILNVGGKELFIADACSGFRSLTTLLALGAIYAYLQKIPNTKKWFLFLSVIPLGILGNILRISTTGLMSYYFGSKLAEGFFHSFSGIIVFICAIVGLMYFSHRLTGSKNEQTEE